MVHSQRGSDDDRLKVGQIIRRPGHDGEFGVVVSVAGQSARIKVGSRILLQTIGETKRLRCRDRFCKVFRGEDNISAEVFIESDAGSFRLSPHSERWTFAHRFWWGLGEGEAYDLRRLQTAAIILSKVPGVDLRVVDLFAERFALEVVRKLTPQHWYLTEFELREWLENASAEFAAEGGVGHVSR